MSVTTPQTGLWQHPYAGSASGLKDLLYAIRDYLGRCVAGACACSIQNFKSINFYVQDARVTRKVVTVKSRTKCTCP